MSTNSTLITGRAAKTYDWRGTLWARIKARHLTFVNPQPEQSVLDVGCGTGKSLQLLYKKCAGKVRLHGVEPSVDMFGQAWTKLSQLGVDLRQDIAQKLPYPANSFDWVISTQVLHHLPLDEKQKMLSEMHRVLKPGGHMVLSDWGTPTTTLGKSLDFLWRKHAYVQENRTILNPKGLRSIGFKNPKENPLQFGVVHHLTAQK